MSGDRTSPRYDVVATTRRSWSREQKKAIVAEIDVGGATLSKVARRHGIHSSLLFRWRKTLGSVMGAAPAVASVAMSASPTSRFMPVMLPPPSLPAPAITPVSASTIEIVLDGGRTMRVGADVDTGALVRIIEALEKSR
ncbi:MAG: transposase [Hyphomicrobiaceae bacterium]